MDTCLSSSAESALFPEDRLTREDYDAQRSGNVEHTWSDVLGSWLKDAIGHTSITNQTIAINVWSDCAGMSTEVFALKQLLLV